MHIFYTPSEKTQELLKKIHTDRENGLKWRELEVKYKKSRAWLAAIYRWYLHAMKEGIV